MKAAVYVIILAVPLALASPVFPDYPVKQAKDCSASVENAGIVIGLEAVEAPQLQKAYFGVNLTRKGFVPVYVVIQNTMSANSAIFDKTKVTYGDGAATPSVAKTGSGSGKAIAWSAVPFFGPFAAAQVISDASQIQKNLLKKELRSTTLSPNVAIHGFLYIPTNPKTGRKKIALRIPISKVDTDEIVDLSLIF
jgi:hypothetical protein